MSETHTAVAVDGSLLIGPAQHADLIDDMAQLRGWAGRSMSVSLRVNAAQLGVLQQVFHLPGRPPSRAAAERTNSRRRRSGSRRNKRLTRKSP